MATQTPPSWRPTALATPLGWAHEQTGEQLVSWKGLTPAPGTETYIPNSLTWMKAYNGGEGPVDPEPGDGSVFISGALTGLPNQPGEINTYYGYLRDELAPGIGPAGSRVSGSTAIATVLASEAANEADPDTVVYRTLQVAITGSGSNDFSKVDIVPETGPAVSNISLQYNDGTGVWITQLDSRGGDAIPLIPVGMKFTVLIRDPA